MRRKNTLADLVSDLVGTRVQSDEEESSLRDEKEIRLLVLSEHIKKRRARRVMRAFTTNMHKQIATLGRA